MNRTAWLPLRRSWIVPPLFGVFCLLVYNANFRQIGAGDTLPARFQPLILLQQGTLSLEDNAHLVAHGHPRAANPYRPVGAGEKVTYFEPWAFWMVRTRQHQLASLYPVVTPLLVTPLYLPAVRWLDKHGWEQPNVGRVAEFMEKLAASFLASVASVLMLLVLRRDCGKWSLPLAAAFAFGTNTWMISSQALWQHGTGELLIALALLLLGSKVSRLRAVMLGCACVLMAANRPPDALIAGAIALFLFWSQRRGALWFLAGAVVPLAALLWYNLFFIGDVAGGYGMLKAAGLSFFQLDWRGVPGLLVSPTRGLLVFTPFLVFLPVGLRHRLRTPESKGLAVAFIGGVAAQLLLYSQADWRAGSAWGPRWLTDILPILLWMLAPAPLVLRPLARYLFVVSVVASVAVQAIGAFWYTKVSDELIYAGNPTSKRAAWDPGNIPFLTELRHPPAKFELLHDTLGSLDRVGETLVGNKDEIPRLEPGAVLEGWALTGNCTPAQVIVLIDGVVIGWSMEFLPRPDVNEAMDTAAPSGWRTVVNTQGVLPGERVLQLAVRIAPRSDIRILREQRVLVIAPESPGETVVKTRSPAPAEDLDALATRAAALLRDRQNERGYWLTTHTKGLLYEFPKPEMNTYLTAMLVDLLSPVAGPHGLSESVERARAHLGAQIESNGLVRYHGLPDGPTIGTLGHVITPDSDDTALTWKIAGPGNADPRLRPMLDVLAQYRDSRGFYRTWLAPTNEFQGLDPGKDPNPTDIAIQMHVYLMLREFDPPAARQLELAMQRSFQDDEVWVYYAKSPLVPYLRSAELRQLGCDIPLPSDRLALPAEGQEVWSEAARLYVEIAASPQDAALREAIRSLLERLGSEEFAGLRGSPPMLYHNDLTATVKRYYWSEDFGYALWLRLYAAEKWGSMAEGRKTKSR